MTDDQSFISTTTIEPITEEYIPTNFDGAGYPPGPTDEAWPTQTPKRGIRLRIPTLVLFAVLLVAAGLWGGSILQKHNGSSSTTGAGAARAAFARAGGSGFPFSSTGSGTAGGTSGATTGTVTDIIGNTLYVTGPTGNLVKVTLSSSAAVTRSAKSTLSSLQPGDSVVIQGTTPTNGSMVASSVSATAAGVSTTKTGFAGAAG